MQGLVPDSDELLQLPSVTADLIAGLTDASRGAQLMDLLAQREVSLVNDVRKAVQHTWKLDILDLYLKGSLPPCCKSPQQ